MLDLLQLYHILPPSNASESPGLVNNVVRWHRGTPSRQSARTRAKTGTGGDRKQKAVESVRRTRSRLPLNAANMDSAEPGFFSDNQVLSLHHPRCVSAGPDNGHSLQEPYSSSSTAPSTDRSSGNQALPLELIFSEIPAEELNVARDAGDQLLQDNLPEFLEAQSKIWRENSFLKSQRLWLLECCTKNRSRVELYC